MLLNKRNFLKLGTASAAATLFTGLASASHNRIADSGPENIKGDIKPISVGERKSRIAKVQKNLQKAGIAALIVEPGSSMIYFTGVRWWRSERLTALIIPAEGEIAFVTPFFEEPSVRESMTFGNDVRSWHEHESPFKLVAQILKDRGYTKGKIAFEETVRYFVVNRLMETLGNGYDMTSGRDAVLACRMFKSKHELSLMHKANEITLRAYEYTYKQLKSGMTSADLSKIMKEAQTKLGGKNKFAMALIGKASAYPHGIKEVKTLEEGDIVLMDSGAEVFDYESDISRTFVFGEANKKQRSVWNTVRKGQDIAFEAAQIGKSAGSVDDSVRAYYEKMGYGPDYRSPGLTHRTGHGIGMDGHEEINFVRGENGILKPGMCFSNEPGIYIMGAFGVRLEDCIYMTETGPKWFTKPPKSLDEPIGQVMPLNI